MPVEVPQDLAKRAAEILEWQKTGVLSGDALRSFQNEHADPGSRPYTPSLRQAEDATTKEALLFIVALYEHQQS